MKLKNSGGQINSRRHGALERLEKQLKAGTKPTEGKPYPEWFVLLSDDDKTRIKSEINTLKSKVVTKEVAISYKPKKYRGVR